MIYEKDNTFAETSEISVYHVRDNEVESIFAILREGQEPEYVKYPRSMGMTARDILEGLI